ncbi:MAG: NAD-dependent epimerase/dehydratase family protein [Chromatiaceae bacterium]|nr:NAD-dependent epimerase/dehydratase family protein [Chromatiaceae bacterium]
MHILISGANGYLGSVLLQALSAQPEVEMVTALVRHARRFDEARDHRFPASIRWLDWDDLECKRRDLSGVDIVCHLAAGRNAANCAAVAESLALGARLFRLAAQSGVNGIINASSQAVYGVQPTPWSESARPAPVSIHGMAKLGSELIGAQLAAITEDTRFLSLRLAKLVGPAPIFRIVPDELPHLLAREALAGRDLVLSAEGRQRLDLMDVRDAAAVIWRLIRISPGGWPNVMNVGSGRAVTALEVARVTLAQMQRQLPGCVRPPRILLQRGAGRPPHETSACRLGCSSKP